MSMTDYALYEREEPDLGGVERDIHDAVSREEPWSLVERFAELERVSGSEDEQRAAEYLTGRLADLGIDHERHDPDLYLSIPHRASLSVEGGGSWATDDPEADRPPVKTVAFGGGAASGDLVAVGGEDGDGEDGDVEELLSADVDTDALDDLTGRVAMLEGVLPIGAIEDLEAAGVEGVVVVHAHEDEPHEGIATPVWGGAPEPGEEDRVPDVPIVTVSRTVGDRLAEREGSTVELDAETTTDWFECPVVVAEIEGEADPEEDDFVLLHGHYDSWHVGVADNATGDACLLELARVFAEHSEHLSRNLRVAWWPAHSTGRYAGSTWYAEEFAGELDARCVAHVNADSPGATDATEFEDMLCWMPEADALARGAIDDVAGKDATEVRPPRAGDYSFNNLGVTGAFMLSSNIPTEVREARGYHPVGGCGGHSNAWHLTTDTLDKADPEVLVRDIRVYAVTVSRLLRAPVLPLDFRHTIEGHRETLAEYDIAAAGYFDLSPVRDALEALAREVDAFYEAVDRGDLPDGKANEGLKALSRHLVRVNFASEGKFEQDPAYDRPPYPGLAPAADLPEMGPDQRRFQQVALRRQRNRAVDELRRAREALSELRDGVAANRAGEGGGV